MNKHEQEWSLKQYFVPFTTSKAIHFIIIVGVLVYCNSLFGQFIFDDIINIVKNPYVHKSTNIFSVFVLPHENTHSVRYYRPLTFSLYTILYSLFRENTFFYHIFQLLIAIANTLLVFLVSKRVLGRSSAFILAIIFLVHPINEETVVYIANLQDVLYFFFGIFALYLFQRLTIFSTIRIIIIYLLLFFSLLSKESGILFLPLMIFYSFFFKKNFLKQSILLSILVIIPYGILHYFIIDNQRTFSPSFASGILWNVLFTAPKVFYFYLSTFLDPKDLIINNLWLVNKISFKDFYFPLMINLLFIFFIGLMGVFIRRKKKENFTKFLFFLVWFVIGIIPCFPFWLFDQTVANRWFYFPIVGLLGILGLLINTIQFKKQETKVLFFLLLFVVISVLTIRTIVRNTDFQTRLRIYSHDAPIANNAQLYQLLVAELIGKGDYEEADVQIKKLIALDTNNALSYYYKAVIDINIGNPTEAKNDLKKVFNTPYDIYAYSLSSVVDIKYDSNYKEAEKLLKVGVRKYPQNLRLWELLSYVEYKNGNSNSASRSAQKAGVSLETIVTTYSNFTYPK